MKLIIRRSSDRNTLNTRSLLVRNRATIAADRANGSPQMKFKPALFLLIFMASAEICHSGGGQLPDDSFISPSRPVPTGKAPGMRVKQVKDTPGEKVYAVIFYKGDEALSGL